jgi:hypothetical protein
MRGIDALQILGLIGLGGIGVWNAKQLPPPREMVAPYSAPSTASAKASVVGEKTERKRTRRQNAGGLDEPDQAVALKDLPAFCGGGEGASAALCCQATCGRAPDEADSSVLKSVTKTEAPLSPAFPAGDDFSAGSTGDQIRAQFGEPTARVTEMIDGRVAERYYYYNRDHTKLTMARLRGGVIVSAEDHQK